MKTPHFFLLPSSLFLLSAALALPCRADDATNSALATPPSALVTTLLADGSTNSWTQADLVAALQLMNRKYHRDVETDAGRKAWHGKITSTVVDTNALVKVTTYEDGTEFRDPFKVITPAASAAAISVHTNGLPARLAAARLRRATEKAAVSNVTVIVNARAEAEQAARIAAAIEEAQRQAAEQEAAAATNATPAAK